MRFPKISLAPLLFCALSFASGLNLEGVTSDETATRVVAEWMKSIGFAPANQSGNLFTLEERGIHWIVEARASKTLPDRLIFTMFFKGKRANLGSATALAFVNRLNSEYNTGSYNLDDDGDLIMQYELAFDDELSPALLRKFISAITTFAEMISDAHKAEIERLK